MKEYTSSEKNSDNGEDNGGFVIELVNREKHLKEIKSESVSKERKTLSKIVAGKNISDEVIKKWWSMEEIRKNHMGKKGKLV